MKSSLLCLALLTALHLPALAQEAAPEAATAPAEAPAPRIVCDAPEFDFGTVDNAQNVEHTYVLRNEGTLTLEIGQARPSCGCTVASISERNVPPGGETKITTRLSLSGRQGPQHKAITVESNDPKQPQYILTLKGVAGNIMDVQPPRLMQAQIPAGTQPTNTVTIAGLPGTAFQITNLEATTDRIKAAVETVESGRVYRINVWPSQPMEPGQIDATMVVHTDHPQKPTVEIPVVLMANMDLTVAPRELVFPLASEEPVTRYIIVRARDNMAFQLSGVETPVSTIKTEISPFPPSGYRIQISNFRPTMDMNQRVFRIHTAIPGQPPIDVPIRIVQPAPAAPASPTP